MMKNSISFMTLGTCIGDDKNPIGELHCDESAKAGFSTEKREMIVD